MRTVEMKPDAIGAVAAAMPGGGPVYMVNLLRYRERAEYADRTEFAPCSGREAYYQRYVPVFRRLASPAGIRPFWLGAVRAAVVAPAGEQWDDIGIVEYPSFADFRRVVESPEYLAEASPHRRAALEDWRLIATAKVDLPG